MSDSLDAAMDALEQVVYDAGYEGGFTVGGVNARTAARAAVRKAAMEMVLMNLNEAGHFKHSSAFPAEEMGEEYEARVGDTHGPDAALDSHIRLPYLLYPHGTRVRVTRIEEGA